jgi:hypothetical protein
MNLDRPQTDPASIPLYQTPSAGFVTISAFEDLPLPDLIGSQPDSQDFLLADRKHRTSARIMGPSTPSPAIKYQPVNTSQVAHEYALKTDIMHRIPGLYRILDLHSEQSSGGLGASAFPRGPPNEYILSIVNSRQDYHFARIFGSFYQCSPSRCLYLNDEG